MADSIVSLVPWVEQKVIAGWSWIKSRNDLRRRSREYKQLMLWTRSSLQISTVFDWGHTCDIAEAIESAAHHALGNYGTPSCWAFASRTLFANWTGRPIEPSLWINIVDCFVNSPLSQSSFGVTYWAIKSRIPDSEGLVGFIDQWIRFLHPDIDDLERRIRSRRYPFNIGQSSPTVGLARKRKRGDLSPNSAWSCPHVFDSECYDVYAHEEDKDLEELNKIVDAAAFLPKLLREICKLYFSESTFQRCCERQPVTPRQRALQTGSCRGVQVKQFRAQVNQNERNMLDATSWAQIQSQWARFIYNWDAIVAKVSEMFPFPSVCGLEDLVFHDMATGYVASSAALRKGAKCVSTNGTTIVHPAERAAVVSARCKVISIEGSALDKHSIMRDYSEAALEFSRYALQRCDVVSPRRMTFSEAVRDWESPYAFWDQTPGSLSAWSDALIQGEEGDDYRLVLLRQAIGTKHTLDVCASPHMECSLFGGFIPTESQDGAASSCSTIRLIIDRPLKLRVIVRSWPGHEVVHDRWGCRNADLTKTANGWYLKCLQWSGRPDIYRVATLVPESQLRDLRTNTPTRVERRVLWVS